MKIIERNIVGKKSQETCEDGIVVTDDFVAVMTASAIIYSRMRKEVWMVGDCQAIIGGKLYENNKPYGQEIAEKRVALIKQGMIPAEARKTIEPLLVQAMLDGQNKSYAVIDGFPIYREGVKAVPCLFSGANDVDSENSRNEHEIVLASDGYPFLKTILEESEAALAKQLAHDPQNIKTFIATKGLVDGYKSFDDRTYVRFLI